MILIISAHWDLHARAVKWALAQNGVHCEILDLTEVPTKDHFAFQYENDSNWRLESGGRTVDLSKVRLVWCRKSLIGHGVLNYSGVHPLDLNNVVSEVHTCLQGLYAGLQALLHDVPWVNQYSMLSLSESKPAQLVIAHRVGLNVAQTLFGNAPAAIRKFHSNVEGRVVAKSFKQTRWEVADRNIFQAAHPIQERHLGIDAAIQLCPVIYQKQVEKAFELRILVMGGEMIAAKIKSQDHEHTKADWRLDAHKQEVGIERYELSPATRAKLLALMDQLQIATGSVDMIVGKDGLETFLEINQQGNFLFIELCAPDIFVLQAFAEFLMKTAGYGGASRKVSYKEFLQTTDYAEIPELITQATKAVPRTPHFVFK